MKLKLAVVFSALISATLIAAPSASFAQFKDLKERAKKAEAKKAAKKDGKSKGVRSMFRKDGGGKKADQKGDTKK
jgi:hypothetical protein